MVLSFWPKERVTKVTKGLPCCCWLCPWEFAPWKELSISTNGDRCISVDGAALLGVYLGLHQELVISITIPVIMCPGDKACLCHKHWFFSGACRYPVGRYGQDETWLLCMHLDSVSLASFLLHSPVILGTRGQMDRHPQTRLAPSFLKAITSCDKGPLTDLEIMIIHSSQSNTD